MFTKWRSFYFIFFLILYFNACEKNKMPLESEFITYFEEENAVYEAIFTDPTFYPAPKVVFLDSTILFKFKNENDLLSCLPGVSEETVSALISANQTRYPLKRFLHISKPYV